MSRPVEVSLQAEVSTIRKHVTILALVLSATVSSLASFAKRGEQDIGAARAAAIHQCNVKAQKYGESAWGDVELYVYRACMAQHHQKE